MTRNIDGDDVISYVIPHEITIPARTKLNVSYLVVNIVVVVVLCLLRICKLIIFIHHNHSCSELVKYID